MKKISRKEILLEKVSGDSSCPHFIPPSIGEEIANSVGKSLDLEASKCIAEIAENFALEILNAAKSSSPKANELRAIVENAVLD